jgi:hypothetical protein
VLATPWSASTLGAPSLPAMTRPCARPDLRDALVTPWSSCWDAVPDAVPDPVLDAVPDPRAPLAQEALRA